MLNFVNSACFNVCENKKRTHGIGLRKDAVGSYL